MKKFLRIFLIVIAVNTLIGVIGVITIFWWGNGRKSDGSTDIVAEIPYINDFTCVYYDTNGEKIGNKKTVFEPGDEIRVKSNFTLLPEAYAEGKVKFTVKFIFSADFTGKILSANSSATSDKDLTATFTADDKNSKNCEIETRINVNYSAGSFKIAYAYDDEEYTEACELPLNNDKTLRYTYDEATDGYIVSRDLGGSYWLYDIEEICFPELITGKPITVINKELLKGCDNLRSIKMPNSVTTVRESMFSGCRGLTSIKIPNSVTNIENEAFYNCSSLTSVEMFDKVVSIGERAFYGCRSLKSITIPDSITEIGSQAFSGCDNLQYNEYENAKYLGSDQNPYIALIGPVNTGITSVEINEKTKIISSYAFWRCNSLASVTIPDSVTSIGSGAFENCENLQFNEYGNAMYLGNETNPYVALIKSINTDITNVEINAATKFIYENAFRNCSNLTSITIPDNITYIGAGTFYKCGVKSIFFGGTKAEWWEVYSGTTYSTSKGNVMIKCSDGEIKFSFDIDK